MICDFFQFYKRNCRVLETEEKKKEKKKLKQPFYKCFCIVLQSELNFIIWTITCLVKDLIKYECRLSILIEE